MLDAYGNPVPNYAVTFTSAGTNIADVTMTPPWGTTSSSGVLTTSVTSTTAEPLVMTATAGSLVQNTNVTFVAGSANATTSVLTASPSPQNTNATTTITATIDDAFGNPVANQAVTFTTSGTNYTLSPNAGTTNASGQFVASLTTSTAQSMTVTATFASLNMNTTVVFSAITSVVDLATGSGNSAIAQDNTCAILANGSIKCWGENLYGNLSYGDTVPRGGSPNQMGSYLPTVNLGAGRTVVSVIKQGWGGGVRDQARLGWYLRHHGQP